jgi:hypothetical protein
VSNEEPRTERAAGFTPAGSEGGQGGATEHPPAHEDVKAIASGSTLADISIRNHVFAWMLMAALIGFGLLCFTGAGTVFKGLGVSQNPDVDFPIVNVSVTYEGASPEIMETDVVVDPMETRSRPSRA